MLRRGLLFAATVAVLGGQESPFIDKAEIDRIKEVAREQAQLAQQEILLAKETFARDAMKLAQKDLWAQKDLLAEIPNAMFAAKQALAFENAFGMQKPFFQGVFFQGPKGGGGPLTEDEELKILAIDGLMQSDSERALPVVDKLLQNPQASVRLRLRALQSLGSNNSTKAREIVTRVAKDGSNAELQSRSIQILGWRDGGQNKQLLSDIYASAANAEVKRQIIRAWAGMGAKEQLLSVAKSDPNTELRAAAINHLGGMRATADLGALYSAETSTEIRERLLRGLSGSGDWQKLIEIAKTEKNEDLRNRAIQYAGSMRNTGSAEALVEMYGSTTDASLRSSILRALSHQGNAKQLIALARKETNPELKRTALQHLTRMKGEDVTAYLMDLLDK